MKKLILKYRAELIGSALGAIAGWTYWYFLGCTSQTCAITSSPLNSSLYGTVLGGIVGSMFNKSTKAENKKDT